MKTRAGIQILKDFCCESGNIGAIDLQYYGHCGNWLYRIIVCVWHICIHHATNLKILNRILWSFVVINDLQCRCSYSQEILITWGFFFGGGLCLFRNIQLKQFVGTNHIAFNRTLGSFVVIKDILCTRKFRFDFFFVREIKDYKRKNILFCASCVKPV